jgi:hypothetical protein
VLATGATLTLLLGSGLLSLVSDSVLSDDNKVSSGEYAPLDLRIAKVAAGTGCSSGSYRNGPIKASFDTGASGDVELDGDPWTIGDSHLCFKNFGTKPGRLWLTYADLISLELGKCLATESDPNGGDDTSCADAEVGELEFITDIKFASAEDAGLTSPTCATFQDVFVYLKFGLTLATEIGPGEVCRFQPQMFVRDSASDSKRLAAQTDGLIWDFVFNLQRFEDAEA